jgi:hypothetical protein
MSACSPKIQGSTPEEIAASIQRVRNSLPDKDRERFTESVQLIAFGNLDMMDLLGATADSGQAFMAKMGGNLKGLTGQQVIAKGDSIREARAARERTQALKEIAELRAKRDSSAQARQGLAKFQVLRSRFREEVNVLNMTEPKIELTVVNGTSIPVSRAYFVGTIASPGRAVPWHRGDFNYQIRGGLEPGEQASWVLEPNMFSGWGNIHPPKDAVMTVELVQLDGPDGKPAFSTRIFTAKDSTRLVELEGKYRP